MSSTMCNDPQKRVTIEKALDSISYNLKESELHVTQSKGLLKITVDGTERILVDGHAIPCFSSAIPEMMITYVLSQVELISQATDGKPRRDALTVAMYNIEKMILSLHTVGARYYASKGQAGKGSTGIKP